MIQHVIAIHTESGLGLKQRTEWAACQAADPSFVLFDPNQRPKVGTRYWETKTTKNRAIYRCYLAAQTADTMRRFPVVAASLRFWTLTLMQDVSGWSVQAFASPPGTTWWIDPDVDFLTEEGDGNAAWDGGTIAGTMPAASIAEGAYVEIPVDLSAVNSDSTVAGGHTFVRLRSSDETADPGGTATPALDGEDLGGWCEFDGPAGDHPPALILTLDLEGEEMQQLAVPIEAESRVVVAVTRRTDSVDGDVNWGTGAAAIVAARVVCDFQPAGGSNRRETPVGWVDTATHVMIPEVPLPMSAHGSSPGLKEGDDVSLAFEATGATMNFRVVGITWLPGFHQELMLQEIRETP